MRWMGHVMGMVVMRNGHTILFGKPEMIRPAEKTWGIWEDMKITVKK
jgi:hypothetical protein